LFCQRGEGGLRFVFLHWESKGEREVQDLFFYIGDPNVRGRFQICFATGQREEIEKAKKDANEKKEALDRHQKNQVRGEVDRGMVHKENHNPDIKKIEEEIKECGKKLVSADKKERL
jgi:hypothetical protein